MKLNQLILFVGLTTFVSSLNTFAGTDLLIADATVKSEEISRFHQTQKNFIRFTDFIMVSRGSVTRTLIQNLEEILNSPVGTDQEQSVSAMIKTITSAPLTSVRKKMLEKILPLAIRDKKALEQQLHFLKISPLKLNGSVALPFKNLRDDEELTINGFRINPGEISQIKLAPKTYYQVTFLSNTSLPHYQWALSEDLLDFQRINLVGGSCENPKMNDSSLDASAVILFPNGCIAKTPKKTDALMLGYSKTPSALKSESETSLSSTLSENETWKKNRTWALGGSLLLVGALIYEVQKNYEISVTVPF